MAHLKRTGILLRWARGSNCNLLVMLSAHFHMRFIVSWAKATAPTRIYCIHGRSNNIHTYSKNKGPCISLSPYEKAVERWQCECKFQFCAPFFDEPLALVVWNHMLHRSKAVSEIMIFTDSVWFQQCRHSLCKVTRRVTTTNIWSTKRCLFEANYQKKVFKMTYCLNWLVGQCCSRIKVTYGTGYLVISHEGYAFTHVNFSFSS